MATEETGISRQHYVELILAQEDPDLTNVVVVFDVDQVLADIIELQVREYNDLLKLDIPEEEMKISDYHRQTFDVPQIAERRTQDRDRQEKNDKMLFEDARTKILESERIHLNFPPMAGAVSGVSLLSSLIEKYNGTFGGYFTARRPKAGVVTPQWLEKNGFREGTVVVCTDSKDKLTKIIQQFSLEKATNTRVFLLDDSIQSLAQAAKTLLNETNDPIAQEKIKGALSRITVGAFSYTQDDLLEMEGVNKTPFSVVSFPWWTTDAIRSTIKTLSNNS